MKKNLYRGIRKDNRERAFEFPFVGETSSYILYAKMSGGSGSMFFEFDGVEVFPETVGQYTGLPDKYGEWIFEGDIVKQTFEKAIREPFEYDLYGEDVGTVVIYGEDVGPVVLLPSKGVCIKNPISLRKTDGEVDISGKKLKMYKEVCSGRCEIIGNIHDNPELLLESKEECNT